MGLEFLKLWYVPNRSYSGSLLWGEIKENCNFLRKGNCVGKEAEIQEKKFEFKAAPQSLPWANVNHVDPAPGLLCFNVG